MLTLSPNHYSVILVTLLVLRLTFTANVKPLTKFFILQLYYITAFAPILKYIKQLLNLCYLAMI